ncbi:MAG: histidine phosphatase family protein [Patescibacteria group bacterium]
MIEFRMPEDLYLVRHGQSVGNLARKKYEENQDESAILEIFSQIHESEYELTPLGIEQAKLAGAWLKKEGLIYFDRMLVSSNKRAKQTASYLGLPEVKWMIDFNLRECDGGLFSVIAPSERDLNYADQQKFYDTQPFLFRPPQGESMADLCQRIKIILDTLARECSGKKVIIVCHGHVIRAFRIILERMSPQRSNELILNKNDQDRVPNCSILHYTRRSQDIATTQLSDYFNWFRMIRPAGGGNLEDDFSEIKRKKYSNEELLLEASNQNLKK